MTVGAGRPDEEIAPAGRAGARRLGLALAVLVLVADQASKLFVLKVLDLARRGPVEIAPFLDFLLVWNPGISYGLFPQQTEAGRWGLVAFTVAASGAIGVWLARTRSRFTAVGLGLVLGGAIGNLIDRIRFGAVVDFVHFHVGDFSWYVFNVADATIVIGVVLLLVDAFLSGQERDRARGRGA